MDIVIAHDTSDEARLLIQVTGLARLFARRLVGRNAADDLAQDVALDCLIRMREGRWRVAPSLEALVSSMVWRKYVCGARRAKNRRAREEQDSAERAGHPPQWMESTRDFEEREDRCDLRRVLSELPADVREVFRLVREEGASYRNVSVRRGISFRRVVTYMRNAERHLASRLLGWRTPLDVPPTMRKPSSARTDRKRDRVRMAAS